MTRILDGFTFDMPPAAAEIVALAQYHREKLDDAIFHQEIHLGDYCLAQRKRIFDFTRQFDEGERQRFYQIYDGELKRIADDDELQPADAENGVSIFAIFLVLAIIALILYFAVIRAIIS